MGRIFIRLKLLVMTESVDNPGFLVEIDSCQDGQIVDIFNYQKYPKLKTKFIAYHN